MDTKQLNEISKFLSYVLRHEPHTIGLQLDNEGWASLETLIAGAAEHGRTLDNALIQAVVSSSDKKRFSLSEDGLRIRAVQGHSTTSVSLQHVEKEPPEFLYHGKPVVLKIEALRMHQQGFKFFQAANGVWLTNHVPMSFIHKDLAQYLARSDL